MNEERAELISALLDDELEGEQREQALEAVLAEPALRQRWHAYHVIGDALRARQPAAGDLAARIRAIVEQEPELPRVLPARVTSGSAGAWWKPLGGLALAASLATVAVLGGRSMEPLPAARTVAQTQTHTQPTGGTVVTSPESDAPETPVAARTLQFAAADSTNTRLQWTTAQPAVAQRLNAYLVDYSEYLGSDLRGMLPYARVVGYDGRQR